MIGPVGVIEYTTQRLDDDGTVEIAYHSVFELESADYLEVSDYLYTYRCDEEGVQLLEVHRSYTQTSGHGTYENDWVQTYSDPLLVMIWGLEDYSDWEDDFAYVSKGTVHGDKPFESSDAGTAEFEYADHDPVTVPAGTFDAIEEVGSEYETPYYDADLGYVQSEWIELVEWTD